MTQDPVDGVQVRLADGTTRTLPASQVEYVGRANRFDLSLWHTVSYLIDIGVGHFETGLSVRYAFGG